MKDRYSSCVFYNSENDSYTLYIVNDRTNRCIVAKEFFDFKEFSSAFNLSLEEKGFGSIENDKDLMYKYNDATSEHEIPGTEIIIVTGDKVNVYIPMIPLKERERWLNILSRNTCKVSRIGFRCF